MMNNIPFLVGVARGGGVPTDWNNEGNLEIVSDKFIVSTVTSKKLCLTFSSIYLVKGTSVNITDI